jgi:tRNA A-37 threonylcarbamoyl transferase component Bud32
MEAFQTIIKMNLFGDKFQLVEKIHEDKYFVIDNGNKRIVKKINSTPDDLKQVIVLKRIKCENIIQCVLDYFIEDKKLFILLDYHDESKTLDKFDFKKIIDETILSKWYRDLAMSIDYLHLHDIAHGKITTNNIFISDSLRLILGEIEITLNKSKTSDLTDLFNVMKYLGFTQSFTDIRSLVKFLIKNF